MHQHQLAYHIPLHWFTYHRILVTILVYLSPHFGHYIGLFIAAFWSLYWSIYRRILVTILAYLSPHLGRYIGLFITTSGLLHCSIYHPILVTILVYLSPHFDHHIGLFLVTFLGAFQRFWSRFVTIPRGHLYSRRSRASVLFWLWLRVCML